MVEYILQHHYYWKNISLEEVSELIKQYDICIPYLDEFTFRAGKILLEDIIRLMRKVVSMSKWTYEIEVSCKEILYRKNVKKNIQLAKELVLLDRNGIEKNIKLIVDGDDLWERIRKMEIDEDIISNQLSIQNCKEVIETIIYRKCDIYAVYFSEEKGYYSGEMKCRLESEGTRVFFESRRQNIEEKIATVVSDNDEIVLVSTCKNIFDNIDFVDTKRYIYTISFCKDIPSELVPLLFFF